MNFRLTENTYFTPSITQNKKNTPKYSNYMKNIQKPAVELRGGGAREGLALLVVLMAPLVQLIFRGSGGPQNGPPRAAKRPP